MLSQEPGDEPQPKKAKAAQTAPLVIDGQASCPQCQRPVAGKQTFCKVPPAGEPHCKQAYNRRQREAALTNAGWADGEDAGRQRGGERRVFAVNGMAQLDSAHGMRLAEVLVTSPHCTQVEQYRIGLVRLSGVTEMYCPTLPNAMPSEFDRNMKTEQLDAKEAQGEGSKTCYTALTYDRRWRTAKLRPWTEAYGQQLAQGYITYMDRWMGRDTYYLHCGSVLAMQMSSGGYRAVHFCTATPVLHLECYNGMEQIYPSILEMHYAANAHSRQLRLEWLERAKGSLTAWANDFKMFGFLSGPRLGDKAGNSPLEFWRRSRARADVKEEDGGLGRSEEEMRRVYKAIDKALLAVEAEVGLRIEQAGTKAVKARVRAECIRRIGQRAWGQMPHIDVRTHEVQLATALTDNCAPTIVYQGADEYTLATLATQVGRECTYLAKDGYACFRQLLLEPELLMAGMQPATKKPLMAGDSIVLRGGVVHARPW